MKTVTLAEYNRIGPAWAQPDCEHAPGLWRRDLRYPLVIPARFVTECQRCGVTMLAEGTEFGRITRILENKP